MVQFCLVQNGYVRQVEIATFPVHHSLDWVEDSTDTVQVGWSWDGVSFTDPNAYVPPTKDELKEHLADYRWRKEQGGITFNGIPIRTDERSQRLLGNVQRKIVKEANDANTRRVKTLVGFITMDNATLETLYDTVVEHVQKCFDTEDAVIPLIEAGTLTTEAEVEANFDARFAV